MAFAVAHLDESPALGRHLAVLMCPKGRGRSAPFAKGGVPPEFPGPAENSDQIWTGQAALLCHDRASTGAHISNS